MSLSVVITFSLLSYCYYKKNTLGENNCIKKAVTRNLVYLMIASLLFFAGNVVPTLIDYIRAAFADAGILGVVIVEHIFPLFSVLPTPIVAIVTLQPLRQALREIFKNVRACVRCKKNQVTPSPE